MDFKNPQSDPATHLEPAKLAALYQEFIAENPMVSIEDPFDQDDWAAWTDLTANTSIQVFNSSTFVNCKLSVNDLATNLFIRFVII